MNSSTDSKTISQIREFNRFYTNVMGILDEHILNSKFSLTEARILFELNEQGYCKASKLSTKLKIDKSYISRILEKFKKMNLISKKISTEDSRVSFIELTKKGNKIIHDLINTSNNRIEQLLSPLSIKESDEVYTAMKTIKKHLFKVTTDITIRPFSNEDKDFIISSQINLYKQEYSFNSDKWKAYVSDGVNQLINKFCPEKDCIYILEVNNNPCGCIAVKHMKAEVAQLRFYFIESTLRGLGAGNMLINKAIDFSREKNYKQLFLWTFSDLIIARHLYQKLGFKLVNTHKNKEWGEPIVEECWNLNLK